jgi:hypothetical protein
LGDISLVIEDNNLSKGLIMANVPSGNLSLNTTTNFYNPFVFGSANYTISGTANGNVPVYVLSSSGYAGANNATFVFQVDQYNNKREGFGA